MPYSDYNPDINTNNGFDKARKKKQVEWDEHKNDGEDHTNCPTCKEFEDYINVILDPTLP